MDIVITILVCILSIVIYLIPGIIASNRGTKNSTQVWVVNLFLGWTFLGRVVALVMAFQSKEHYYSQEVLVYKCNNCGDEVKYRQMKCNNCGKKLTW